MGDASMTKIDDIEGIGPTYAEKLRGAGVASVEALLETAGPAAGRKKLAEATGIADSLLLEWTNHADLFRLAGVGSEYADLLEAAGVDSCPELAQRNATNLAAKLAEINEAKSLVRRVPTETVVAGWVEQAKSLPKVVTH
jgi:predicted flap endonuclease-1-like 5' DNA nuclease